MQVAAFGGFSFGTVAFARPTTTSLINTTSRMGKFSIAQPFPMPITRSISRIAILGSIPNTGRSSYKLRLLILPLTSKNANSRITKYKLPDPHRYRKDKQTSSMANPHQTVGPDQSQAGLANQSAQDLLKRESCLDYVLGSARTVCPTGGSSLRLLDSRISRSYHSDLDTR